MPFEYAEYAKIMLDLAATAFQTDSTRVITIVLGREGSLRTYNEIGVSGRPSSAIAPWQPGGVAREAVEDQPVPHADLRAVHRPS